MSDEEFLARWSRRKREARVAVDAPPPTEPAETSNPVPSATAENPADAEVDLSRLPPIDAIDAATDVTAFLRRGIPPELSRAALRRAWAADPAIRDFVGLAENAWDFNDPNAMPGFGPFDCSEAELGALVDRIVGGVRRAADGLAAAPAEQKDSRQSANPVHTAPSEARVEAISDHGPPNEISTGNLLPTPAAVQPASFHENEGDQIIIRRRMHGGALPR